MIAAPADPVAPELRPYQAAAVAAVRERYAAGDRATLVVLPTGTGKTVVFSEVARRVVANGRRVLVLAHRRELLDQAIGKLATTGVRAELEQGPARAGDAPVVVASVATLRGPRLASWPADAFALVIIDEAHHATAASYRSILAHFARARVLGVTATPDRADGAGLGAIFASVAYRYDLAAAIRDGWLAPIRARRVRVEGLDLDGVRTTAGDLDAGQLGGVMRAPAVVEATAAAILAEVGQRPCVAFTVDVAHAIALADAINAHPGPADAELGAALPRRACYVSGKSTPADREAAAADLAAGRVQVVCNAALWVEGFDCPAVAAVAIARPTKSRGLYAQMVGRATRLAAGKVDALVVDIAGATRRHRLVTAAGILAGDLPEELAELAAQRFDAAGGTDALAAVAAVVADGQAQRAREALRWLVEDVADVLGADILEGNGAPAAADRHEPGTATPVQRDAIARAGLDAPPALSSAQAARILDALNRRRVRGLATFRQVRAMQRLGVGSAEAIAMPFNEANNLITELISRRRAHGGRDAGGYR